MKRLLYFVLLLAGFSAVHSCKDLLDENGDPLVDINNNSGLIGPRALYREITDADTIAEYHYNGLLLSEVIGIKKKSKTKLMYSGDRVSQITFDGFLDEDNDDVLDKDSTSYSQLFTYGNSGRLESISEIRKVYTPGTGTPPGPFVLSETRKTLYNLGYAADTNKLNLITKRIGEEVSGTQFAYTVYLTMAYTYIGDNVSKVEELGGLITGGVFGTPIQKFEYTFSNYDTQISAYTLLPFAYKVSQLASTEDNLSSFMLSPNSPKRISRSDLSLPIPAPDVFSTDYNYDPQTYVKKGFGINFIYKPL